MSLVIMVRSINITSLLSGILLAVFMLASQCLYAHLPQRADCVVIIEMDENQIGILRKLYIGEFLAFEIMKKADTNQDDIIQQKETEQIQKIISERIDALTVRIHSNKVDTRLCSRELIGVPNRVNPRVIQFSQLFTCSIPAAVQNKLHLNIETGDIRLPTGEYRVFSSLSNIPSNTCFSVDEKRFFSELPGSYPTGFELLLTKTTPATQMDMDRLREILSFNTVDAMSQLNDPERFRVRLSQSAAPLFAVLSGVAAFMLGLILIQGIPGMRILRLLGLILFVASVTLSLQAILTTPSFESKRNGLVFIIVWTVNAVSACMISVSTLVLYLFRRTVPHKRPTQRKTLYAAAGSFLTITGAAAILTGLYADGLIHHPLLNRLLGL